MIRQSILAVIVLCALTACSRPGPPARKTIRPDHDMVAAIRAAGRSDDSAVQVTPMRDAGTEALLRKVRADESAGAYQKAAARLDTALQASPRAPELLQDRAEVAVRLRHYNKAVQLAMRSWRLGPKVGSLCARNWQTVVEIRMLYGDSTGAASARKQVAKCRVAGVKRM